MNSVRPLIIVALLTACSTGDSARTSSDTSSASAAVETSAETATDEPTANDISNYKLTMDKMRKYAAAMNGFATLAKSDSAAAEEMGTHADQSTAQTIAKIESNSRAMKVLSDAGLSAKDYVWITAAWLQAAMTTAMVEANTNAKLPAGQNTQNIEFVRAHKAELEALMKESGSGR